MGEWWWWPKHSTSRPMNSVYVWFISTKWVDWDCVGIVVGGNRTDDWLLRCPSLGRAAKKNRQGRTDEQAKNSDPWIGVEEDSAFFFYLPPLLPLPLDWGMSGSSLIHTSQISQNWLTGSERESGTVQGLWAHTSFLVVGVITTRRNRSAVYFHGLRELVHYFDFFGPRERRRWGCGVSVNGWKDGWKKGVGSVGSCHAVYAGVVRGKREYYWVPIFGINMNLVTWLRYYG